MLSLEAVAALRAQLWDAGFRPVPVLTADKRPIGKEWQLRARQDPPECIRFAPVAHALNIGILCDGLRAIDIDVDDPDIAKRCRAMVLHRFGEAPVRIRANSPRCLILYRATQGEPEKLVLAGSLGKIEALGKGQQFVAFGRHPSGADLEWFPEAPGQEALDALPAISEHDLVELLNELAPILDAPPIVRANGHDRKPGDPQADPLRIAVALHGIPNTGPADWEAWNRVGMAVWRATGGSDLGFDAFDAWSARHLAYDADETAARWKHYFDSPPTSIGAGTLFRMARDTHPAPVHDFGEPPPTPDDPGYFEDLDREAAMSPAQWEELEALETGHAIPAAKTAKGSKELLWKILEPWDEAQIPVRPWIARGYLMRRSVTVVSGPGSAGKSSLMVSWAAALVLDCAFHRMRAAGPMRIATYNVEDDRDEQRRRFSATLKRMGSSLEDMQQRLAILGPESVGTLLHTARDGRLMVNTPVMDQLETFVADFKPDVLMLDPFVELHAAEENDNVAVRAVMARFRAMAIEHNMAVVILHHSRKGFGEPGDAETLRGASSIVGAARVVLTVNVMSAKEAETFNTQEDDRRDFFRLDGAKNNYAPLEQAEWFQRHEIQLANGDGVAVAWPWRPPTLFSQVSPADVNRVLDIIATPPAGWLYSPSRRGKSGARWAGQVLVDELQIPEEQAAAMVATWIKNGLLKTETYYDEAQRKDRLGVRVDDSKRPTI